MRLDPTRNRKGFRPHHTIPGDPNPEDNPRFVLIRGLAANDKFVFLVESKRLANANSALLAEPPAAVTVNEILACTQLSQLQQAPQSIVRSAIDAAKSALTLGLGVEAADFVEVPALYEKIPSDFEGLAAFFPGMVNFQIVDNHLVVPAPFGPRDPSTKRDQFQVDFENQLASCGAYEEFDSNNDWVDVWWPYHLQLGEAHCGSNVRTDPSADAKKWWKQWPIK